MSSRLGRNPPGMTTPQHQRHLFQMVEPLKHICSGERVQEFHQYRSAGENAVGDLTSEKEGRRIYTKTVKNWWKNEHPRVSFPSEQGRWALNSQAKLRGVAGGWVTVLPASDSDRLRDIWLSPTDYCRFGRYFGYWAVDVNHRNNQLCILLSRNCFIALLLNCSRYF